MTKKRGSSDVAALFFERFKDSEPYESEGALVRKGNLSKKQAKWLSDVWGRENRDAVTSPFSYFPQFPLKIGLHIIGHLFQIGRD
jgi:hypothetical protein